ncbi:SRPBCC family protein [Phototrophicus methaneseepsis]|uniref:SRPBCC family protein n=1 Tax=Phototrophicus methaneseepsis TaxID=2710758 RepID=A0A7S8IER0_9CHLR|nr:SRPBCC family protein [Phototrophicus methaneseepsis]QPC82709.1 SRPBCC family protein [Phototrophicus methaneseepsis]
MPTIEQKFTINRPVIEVFRVATDYKNASDWQPDTLSVNMIAGDPIRSGTMLTFERRFMGRTIIVNVDVVDFQRNKLVEWQGAHGGFRYHRLTEFISTGGSTEIHDTLDINLGWIRFWYIPFFKSAVNSQISKEWANLKQQVESGAGMRG